MGSNQLTTPSVIILGAGRPHKGSVHSVLHSATGESRVLDWMLRSLAVVSRQVTFITGYQGDEIRSQFPSLMYVDNPEWQDTGAVNSLLCADLNSARDYFVSYADVLYRQSAVRQLTDAPGDIAILVDTQWQKRFENRTHEDLERAEKVNLHAGKVTRLGREIPTTLADAEFVGLVRLSKRAAKYLHEQAQDLPDSVRSGNLSQLLDILRARGFETSAVDVAGDWAELNEPADLTHFVLGTKAQTLRRLQNLVRKSRIEDQFSFTVAQWQDSQSDIIRDIQTHLGHRALVVRSSALSEDSFGSANAGAYDSVLNVDGANPAIIRQAVEQVVSSYPDDNMANQVLVQPMVSEVAASGVAFTRTLAHGGPYYVINYDDVSQSTESITSGTSRDHKTMLVYRNATLDPEQAPLTVQRLLPALREIEQLLDYDALDVEFAISQTGTVHILQVRPIAVQHEPCDHSAIEAELQRAENRFQQLQVPAPFVQGDKALFGIMPDWNPAEIIGTRPGRLAASLYRYLIMDDIWATQRAEFGCRDVRPQPLLTEFAGHPYVNIRASFNSLIPANVPDDLARRLVNFYQDWLEQNPELHDKVEFDVVPTCYSLDMSAWQERMSTQGSFSPCEIEQLFDGLKAVTRSAIERTPEDWQTVRIAEQRFEKLQSGMAPPLAHTFLLLEEAKRYGTLPFAHLARSAFVAVTILRSAVKTGILSQAAYNGFMESIETVSHRFTTDAAAVKNSAMTRDDFIARYGHLRPGTYDILSRSYAEDPEHYLTPAIEQAGQTNREATTEGIDAWRAECPTLARTLNDQGIAITSEALENFLRQAIEGREYAKFVFTRHLSGALDRLTDYGKKLGLTRDLLAHVPLPIFQAVRDETMGDSAKELLETAAESGRTAQALSLRVELPPLICQPMDFRQFLYSANQPNFVGSSRVAAPCIDLQNADVSAGSSLSGKIALIPQADPGYDWLFSQGIAGLITLYGGANSHMAIRAAEFGMPAAIGVGETRYAQWRQARVLELDPANRRVQVVH